MSFGGIGGATPQGNVATTTGFAGSNIPPYMDASQFGGAIAGGRGAGHKTSYEGSQQTLSVPLFVQPWRAGWHSKYMESTLLFSATQSAAYQSTPCDALLSIPLLNFYLDAFRHRQFIDADEQVEFTSTGRDYLHAATVDQFIERFAFVGVVRNELATDGKELYNPYSAMHQRLLNMDVGGVSKMPNFFIEQPRRGDVLYLVVRNGTSLPSTVQRPDGSSASLTIDRANTSALQVEGVVSRSGTFMSAEGVTYSKCPPLSAASCPDAMSSMQFMEEVPTQVGYKLTYHDDTVAFVYADKVPVRTTALTPAAQAAAWTHQKALGTHIRNQFSALTCEVGMAETEWKELPNTVKVLRNAYAIRLGVVKDACRPVSRSRINAALRSHEHMERLPRIGVLLGV
jgi:hypothetical protein